MKSFVKVCSVILAICAILSPLHVAAFETEEISFDKRVQKLAEEYGVTISVDTVSTARAVMTTEEEENELKELEERLAVGKAALAENNRQAEEAWNAIVESGRLDEPITMDGNSPRATYTIVRFQEIGSYYPNGTTIRCYVTAI